MADEKIRIMNVLIVDAETGETIDAYENINSIAGCFMDDKGIHAHLFVQATAHDYANLILRLRELLEKIETENPLSAMLSKLMAAMVSAEDEE